MQTPRPIAVFPHVEFFSGSEIGLYEAEPLGDIDQVEIVFKINDLKCFYLLYNLNGTTVVSSVRKTALLTEYLTKELNKWT